MTTAPARSSLSHVRWIAGGTGAGKSTVTRVLAERYGATAYDGDAAERTWVFTPDRQPHIWATSRLTRAQRAERTPEQMFRNMAGLHGETIGFVLDDLFALPADGPVLVDYFGITPHDLRPLLTFREQAVFLLPTPEFRRTALTRRFADPARAHANWGDTDHTKALATRLARDELWDAELRRQAADADLPTLTIDGTRPAEAIADTLAERFRL